MTPERWRTLIDKIRTNTATADERLEYVIAELRFALDSGDPPADGHVSDSFHASCCVLRAWTVLAFPVDAPRASENERSGLEAAIDVVEALTGVDTDTLILVRAALCERLAKALLATAGDAPRAAAPAEPHAYDGDPKHCHACALAWAGKEALRANHFEQEYQRLSTALAEAVGRYEGANRALHEAGLIDDECLRDSLAHVKRFSDRLREAGSVPSPASGMDLLTQQLQARADAAEQAAAALREELALETAAHQHTIENQRRCDRIGVLMFFHLAQLGGHTSAMGDLSQLEFLRDKLGITKAQWDARMALCKPAPTPEAPHDVDRGITSKLGPNDQRDTVVSVNVSHSSEAPPHG